MGNKYVIGIIVLLFSLFSLAVLAQDINDFDKEQVNRLKLEGKLTGKENYTNRNAAKTTYRLGPPTTPTSQASTSCNCWIQRDASFQIAQFDGSGVSGGPGTPPDYRNDDWSTVAINLPFNFCFYGQNITQVYINNNGNISVRNPYSTFSGVSFPDTFVMIAPFWADVDTRGANSGLVYYSITPTHMIVQWDHVGYFPSEDDKLNTFQLIITDGTDPIIPIGQNVSFCYQDMQWTTGGASNGVNGFGGIPATVGVNQGNGIDYLQFGLFDQPGTNYDGAFGSNDQVDWLDNQSFNINACVNTTNIPPVLNSLNICDTIKLCQNTTYVLTANYLSPEQSETTTINYFFGGMTGISVISNTPGNAATLVIEIIGQTSNLGFHTISVTAVDNGTPAAATNSNFVIEVMPAPLPSFTYTPSSPVTANSPVSFTNTTPPGSLLTWDFGDGSPTSTVPNPQHTYTTGGTFNVTLSAMFPNGCITTVTQQVDVTMCSPAVFTVDNACLGTPSTVTYTGTATANAVFTWDFNGANVLSGSDQGPFVVLWNNAGTYNVSLTVTEPTCSTSASLPVDIYTIPVASITSIPQLCEGDSPVVSFDGNAGPTATYSWDFGNATVISGSGAGPYNLQWSSAGNDQVSVIVDDHGCKDTSRTDVIVNPIPTADFNLPAAACANDILNVNYTGTASGNANYFWDFDGGTVVSGSGQGPYTVNWNNGGLYSVSLSVTENGCPSQPVNMPLNVTDIPQVSISPVPALCNGGTGTVTFTGVAGPTATYNWNFGNAIVLSGSGAGPYDLQWNNAGNDQVQLNVTENGCASQSFIDVTVHQIPTSDFVINNSACVGSPVNLSYSGTASSNGTFNWSFSGGTVVSGSGIGPYSVVWNAQGNYNISLVVIENGCTSPQTDIQAVVNPLPFVYAGSNQIVCSGVPVSIGSPAVAGESYHWNPITNLNDPDISDPVVTPVNNSNATQTDEYVLETTDANGCRNTDSVLVSSYPVPLIYFDTPPGQCIRDNQFIFSAGANIPVGVNYLWTFSPEADVPSSTQPDVYVKYSTTGTFPVILAADYNGCLAQPKTDSVEVYPMPTSDFVPQVTKGCEPLTVPFTNYSTGDLNTYSWNFDDGSTDSTTHPVHEFVHAGLYDVALIAINKYGCETDTIYPDLIDVYPVPGGQFVPNPQVANILAPIIQFQNYSTNATIYSWDFGDNDTSMIWNPTHEYADTGNYLVTLMLESPKGCRDTVTGMVRVEDNFSFYIPNTFTPNDDGINDAFRGYGIAFRSYTMNIYNRWGELIFTTDNYDRPWDGKLKSGVIQNDVYVYRFDIIDQHNEEHTFVGNVSLVR